MQWWEVQRLINGIRRRQRPHWEQIRWLGWWIGKLLGEKKTDSSEELMTFPWEKEDIDPDVARQQTEDFVAQVRAENEAKRKAMADKAQS